MIEDYEKQWPTTFDKEAGSSWMKRILILNGTTHSDWPNLIIGKLIVEISYWQEKVKIES